MEGDSMNVRLRGGVKKKVDTKLNLEKIKNYKF